MVHSDQESNHDLDYEKLFNSLDLNNSGKITINELLIAFEQMGMGKHAYGNAMKFMKAADASKSNDIDFDEFVKYLTEHQKNLRVAFKKFDTNSDGVLDAGEIRGVFMKLGIVISKAEALELLKKVDPDGTMTIDWPAWRDFLLLHHSAEIEDIIKFWGHNSFLDVGEELQVPDELKDYDKTGLKILKTFCAGGFAGAVSRTCTAPFDRIKVVMQVRANSKNKIGIISCLRFLLNEGGVLSMWRGNAINVLKIAPETAIKFMAYEQVKRLLNKDSSTITPGQRFISGSSAGLIAQSVIYPMEVIKTRLVLASTGQFTSISDCASKVYRREGLRAFYKGYVPNALGIIPYAGMDLMVYETLKGFYMQSLSTDSHMGVLLPLSCGAISSSCGQLLSYPLALVRTQMQAKATEAGHSQITMVGTFKKILYKDGIVGFYRGIIPNFLKVIPAVSTSYVVYEKAKSFLLNI